MEFCIGADVLDGYRHFDKVLDLADLFGGYARGFEGVRHGQQGMGIATIHATPAQMIREPRGLCPPDKFLEPAEVVAVERLRRAAVHGDAMLHTPLFIQNMIWGVRRP